AGREERAEHEPAVELGADQRGDRHDIRLLSDPPRAALGVLAGVIIGDRPGPPDLDLVVGHWLGPRQSSRSRQARSAARPGKESMTMCSSTACAPAPRAPRPSSVGTPIAAVKLPSLPPPVEPSLSSSGIVRAIARARSNSRAIAGVRSIGGRLKPPSTRTRAP